MGPGPKRDRDRLEPGRQDERTHACQRFCGNEPRLRLLFSRRQVSGPHNSSGGWIATSRLPSRNRVRSDFRITRTIKLRHYPSSGRSRVGKGAECALPTIVLGHDRPGRLALRARQAWPTLRDCCANARSSANARRRPVRSPSARRRRCRRSHPPFSPYRRVREFPPGASRDSSPGAAGP